jgi:hypothetical protein
MVYIDANFLIYIKDLTKGTISKVYPTNDEQWTPSISGNKVVWQQGGLDGIAYMKNIDTGVTSKVYSVNKVQFNPIISGNTIVWSQENAVGSFYIYRKDLVTGKVSKVA